MSILNFTVEEINLIAMYRADTTAATIDNIFAALPEMYDEDIISIAENASRKLAVLAEPDFYALSFTSVDEGNAYE